MFRRKQKPPEVTDGKVKKEVSLQLGVQRFALEGIRIFACPKCNAPGVYKNDAHNQQNWPGICNPKLVGQPVGDICPNCNANRLSNRNEGELSASMPLWVWRMVLGLKWCLIRAKGAFA